MELPLQRYEEVIGLLVILEWAHHPLALCQPFHITVKQGGLNLDSGLLSLQSCVPTFMTWFLTAQSQAVCPGSTTRTKTTARLTDPKASKAFQGEFKMPLRTTASHRGMPRLQSQLCC